MSKDSFDPRFDPAFQPGFDAAPVAAPVKAKKPAAQSPAQAALEAARVQAESAPVGESDAESPKRHVNPFLAALTTISALLIAGGLGTSQWIRSLFREDDIRLDLDYFSLDILKIASPLAVALGIAIGAGVLFVYAIRWKPRD
jgi:hypothetical protein